MSLLKRFLVNCIAVAAAALILPGIHIENKFSSLIGVTLVLSVFNTFLKPILILLTIPVTIITFGLFLIAINAIIVMIVGNIMNGFVVDSFWWAVLFSFIISLINSLFKDKERDSSNISY